MHAGGLRCPDCGRPMRKKPERAEYLCENPGCPVISVRLVGRHIRKVLRETRPL